MTEYRAVCIQYKFINEVMYVNDTGATRVTRRASATQSTCRVGRSARQWATRIVVRDSSCRDWLVVLRTLIVLTAARDVRTPSANAVSQIRSIHRARVRYARLCVCTWWVRGATRKREDDGASILVARRRVAKRRQTWICWSKFMSERHLVARTYC